nr:reverse transcriptase domain-containing protein [Tanacetum cinerariifolium]
MLSPGRSGCKHKFDAFSIWRKLSFPELTSTQMILELVDRWTTRPAGIAKDFFVKVRKFYFPTDFVVVNYVVDPRVPLILERPFLRTERALIDVYGEELTLRVDDEAITFKVGQTLKYSYNDAESINRIDVIDVACEEYVQEGLGFFDNSKSENPTLTSDPIIALSSPSFTPFEGGDFILEEIEACLIRKSIPLGIDDTDFDLEGDIRLLEELLNKDPSSSPIPPKELNMEEIKTVKSFIDEPPELDLRNYRKIFDINGIDPHFCTHKILMEDDFKPMVQHPRRVNPKIHEVIKKEVIKLLDAGLIYPISDSPWVSPVHCVPKMGGMTVVENEDNELIPTRFRLTHKTKKRLPSLALMERLPTDVPFGLCNPLDTFQRYMMAIFHDIIKKTMEVFMDDFSVFGDSFSSCLSHLDKMLQRIEVDKAKVNVIAKLPHPTSVKENPYQDELEKKEITKTFPFKTLGMNNFRGDSSTPWFANIANYHAGNFIVKGMSSQQKKKLFMDVKHY